MAAMTMPHSLRRSAWAIRATAAGVGGFAILTVLTYVADEHLQRVSVNMTYLA